MPSGAASAHTTVIGSGAPRLEQQLEGVHERSARGEHRVDDDHRPMASDSGSLLTYGSGWWVSSLRAMPMKPMSAFGSSSCAGGRSRARTQDRHDTGCTAMRVVPARW
jgi:hypothetical protein